jgi:aldose 1-epimerase
MDPDFTTVDQAFDRTKQGVLCKRMLTLTSPSLTATFSTLGARLVSLVVDGVDVVMGGGSDAAFLAGDWTTGIVCGRHAGRITNSEFVIDGETHKVLPTFGAHQSHGGPDNFGLRHWDHAPIGNGIRFTLVSPDGDQGFPGEVEVTADYVLKGPVLSLDMKATTTKPTVINLTNHGYWNLIGAKSAFEHEMSIDADRYVVLDDLLLPSGELRAVEGGRFDFRKMRLVAGNYDNCWALTQVPGAKRGTLRRGLTLRDPSSGRRMEVWTTEAGMQMYTCFHWNGKFPGKRGPLHQYEAIAIEPQNFPDACNHSNFPNSIVRPGQAYRNRMEWRFG